MTSNISPSYIVLVVGIVVVVAGTDASGGDHVCSHCLPDQISPVKVVVMSSDGSGSSSTGHEECFRRGDHRHGNATGTTENRCPVPPFSQRGAGRCGT